MAKIVMAPNTKKTPIGKNVGARYQVMDKKLGLWAQKRTTPWQRCPIFVLRLSRVFEEALFGAGMESQHLLHPVRILFVPVRNNERQNSARLYKRV